jgi:hypothetical protein
MAKRKPNEIRLPVNILLAATLCSGGQDGRHYLAGVYLKAHKKGLRCVSTDGHRMLVISRELPKDVPKWLKDGVIVSNGSLKERLALMARVSYEMSVAFEDRMVVVSQSGDHLKLTDPRGECVFRVQTVDGTFPDYEAVMTQITDAIFTGGLPANGEDVPGEDVPDGEIVEAVQMVGGPVPIGFRSQYVRSIADVARVLGSDHVALRTSSDKNGAMVTFPEADGAVLYVMPAQVAGRLAKGNSEILALPLRRSLAALKAHATRNAGWAKEAKNSAEKAEFELKAEEFKGRIATLIEQAPSLKALPAPKKEKAANGAGKAKSGKDRSKARPPAKGKAKKTAEPAPKTTTTPAADQKAAA